MMRLSMYLALFLLGGANTFIHSAEPTRLTFCFFLNIAGIVAIELLMRIHNRIVNRTAARAAQIASQQSNWSGPDETAAGLPIRSQL